MTCPNCERERDEAGECECVGASGCGCCCGCLSGVVVVAIVGALAYGSYLLWPMIGGVLR